MPLTGALIAIVDDEEGVRVALQRLCHAYGAETLGFPSVAQLLAALADRRPDCVIVDAHIPGPNGPELRERFRARAGNIPTIVITGRDDDAAEVRALAEGARACLRKPVDADILLEAIHAAISADGAGGSTTSFSATY